MSSTLDQKEETSHHRGLDHALQAFLRAEILLLTSQVAERDADIAVLRHRLESGVVAKLRMALTGLYLRLLMRCRPAIKKQVKMLESSGYFDAFWYARRYPQCGGSALAAIYHLQVGAFQGHDPGPDFSTSAYYRANRDVAAAGYPALAHYLMYGRHEERLLCPVPMRHPDDR